MMNLRPSTYVILLVSLVIASLIAWAHHFNLDVASYAQGTAVPSGQLQRIQHLEGGIVDEVRVSEGQSVEAGQVLLTLRAEQIEAQVDDLNSQIAVLEIRTERLQAELNNDLNFRVSADLRDQLLKFSVDSEAEFIANQQSRNANREALKLRIRSRQSELKEVRERLGGLKESRRLVLKQVGISQSLLERNLTSEFEHLTLMREVQALEAEISASSAALERIQTQLDEDKANLEVFELEQAVEIRKELQTITPELTSLRERARQPEDSQERLVVRSPTAGVIQTLYFKNLGTVVPPGGTVATLVPADDELWIEAELPLGDVGFVTLGAPAKLMLASGTGGFDEIPAEVIQISADSVIDEQTGLAYYLVRLRPQSEAFVRDEEIFPLRPGISVMATIVTGQRSVLDVLLEPFLGSGIQPLSER